MLDAKALRSECREWCTVGRGNTAIQSEQCDGENCTLTALLNRYKQKEITFMQEKRVGFFSNQEAK